VASQAQRPLKGDPGAVRLQKAKRPCVRTRRGCSVCNDLRCLGMAGGRALWIVFRFGPAVQGR